MVFSHYEQRIAPEGFFSVEKMFCFTRLALQRVSGNIAAHRSSAGVQSGPQFMSPLHKPRRSYNTTLHFLRSLIKKKHYCQICQLTPEVNFASISICCRSFTVLGGPTWWLKAEGDTQPRLKLINNRGGYKQSDSWGSDSCTKSLMTNFIHTCCQRQAAFSQVEEII